MNFIIRSALVGGLSNLLYCLHGSYGSSIETSATAENQKVVAFFDMGSEYGVSKYGSDFFKRISYKNIKTSFFKNSNPINVVRRGLVEEKAMRDFYGDQFGLTDTGLVASGIMAGYNPVSMCGGPGLSKSIDKRRDRITKTLSKKKSKVLEKRLKDVEALRQTEEQARERDRAASARAANAAVYAD